MCPGELTTSAPVLTLALHVPVAGLNVLVTPGVPATDGISQPPPAPALHAQQTLRDRVDLRSRESQRGALCRRRCGEGRGKGGRITLEREHGNLRADEGAWGIAAALPRALIIHEEIAEFSAFDDRTAAAGAENILLDDRTRKSLTVEEEIVSVEDGVAEKFENVEVIRCGARFQNSVDVTAAVASLGGVVKTRADLEFLNDIGAGERGVVELADGVVIRADAFDLVVVVVIAAAVDVHADGATTELRGGVEGGRSAGGEREQLLEILRGEGKFGDRRADERFTGGGIGGAHGEDVGGNLDGLLHGFEL